MHHNKADIELELRLRADLIPDEPTDGRLAVDDLNPLRQIPHDELSKLLAEISQHEFDAIYGPDDRTEYFSLSAARQNDIDNWSVLIVRNNFLTDNPNGTTTIATNPYNTAMQGGVTLPLCAGTAFLNQDQSGGACSGILLGRRNVATAAHCFANTPINQYRAVFGFQMTAAGAAQTVVQTAQTAGFEELWFRASDLVVLRLDRVFRPPSLPRRRREGSVRGRDRVYMIGYPDALPVKLADNAIVSHVTTGAFTTNLDSFHGNSGSPVFAVDGTLEGLVWKGADDYTQVGNCYRPAAYGNNSYGEWITKITLFNDHDAFVHPPLATGQLGDSTTHHAMIPIVWNRDRKIGHLLEIDSTSGEAQLWKYSRTGDSGRSLEPAYEPFLLPNYSSRMALLPIVHRGLMLGIGDKKFATWSISPEGAFAVTTLKSGRLPSIGKNHQFTVLPWSARHGFPRILEWDDETGRYWVWEYTDDSDAVFRESPLTQGTWPRELRGHRLTPLSRYASSFDLILDWEPDSGDFVVWQYHQDDSSLDSQPVKRFFFEDIFSEHELIGLWDNDLLDWVPSTGEFRAWSFNRTPPLRYEGTNAAPK